jgi:hypothetical protein
MLIRRNRCRYAGAVIGIIGAGITITGTIVTGTDIVGGTAIMGGTIATGKAVGVTSLQHCFA